MSRKRIIFEVKKQTNKKTSLGGGGGGVFLQALLQYLGRLVSRFERDRVRGMRTLRNFTPEGKMQIYWAAFNI